jgi:hypothetical protein
MQRPAGRNAADRRLLQIAQAKCFARKNADAGANHPAQPFLCQSVRSHQTGGLAVGVGLNHFALKSKNYFSALQSAVAEIVKLKAQ